MTTQHPSIFAQATALPRSLAAPEGFQPFDAAWLDGSIPACFARQVAAQPDHVAVQSGPYSLTYGELDRLANGLAASLVQRLGAGAEPVLVLTRSDLHAVAAMMGVLKAGKFFVPANPAGAAAEIGAIVRDATARVLVADAGADVAATQAIQASGVACDVIALERITPQADPPDVVMNGASFAQIAYTSGSTGEPKGILKSHRALIYHGMTHINGYFITSADRLMAPAPLVFGASLGIVFSALLSGASLYPVDLRAVGAAGLGGWLETEQITVYHSVASFFRQFAATLEGEDNFPALRILKLGGETIHPEDVARYKAHFAAHCVLRIGLASTEAGNYCWHFVGKETPVEGSRVPVGRALAGTEILLLDESRAPVSSGAPGEIAVKSAYLADGYWRNPELTQARFLPGRDEADTCTYLTGDLGQWRPDGLLEHLGRVDQMIKIRGFRVEIGAVEAALCSLPAVREAAVVAAPGAGGANRLLAYLVPATAQPTDAEVRSQLLAAVPEYMVPARLVWLDRLPVLPNGKVDRRSLPMEQLQRRPALETPFVAPRNALEQQIAGIWADLLAVDEVGVDDSFFALGGDSITAMRMALAVERATGRPVPPEFFRAGTVAALAVLLRGEQTTGFAPDAGAPATIARSPARRTATPRALLRRAAVETALHMNVPQGIRWLAWWSGRAAVQAQLYAPEKQLFLEFLAEIGCPPERAAEAFHASLLGNIIQMALYRWRIKHAPVAQDRLTDMAAARVRLWRSLGRQLGTKPEGFISFTGLEHLRQAHAQGRGVILLTYHCLAQSIFNGALAHCLQTPPVLTLTQKPATVWLDTTPAAGTSLLETHSAERSTVVTLQGLKLLREGGIVQIVNDRGYDRAQVQPQPIAGRLYQLKPGFAEVAAATGAAIVPAYFRFAATGKMHAVCLPPLATPGPLGNDGATARAWLETYAAFVETAWRAAPESLHWDTIRHHMLLPKVR